MHEQKKIYKSDRSIRTISHPRVFARGFYKVDVDPLTFLASVSKKEDAAAGANKHFFCFYKK